MKIAFIVVLYRTSTEEIFRLKKEIDEIGLDDFKIYLIDNTDRNRGYAAGVNEGLKKAIKDDCDLFIIANPDISLSPLKHLRGANWLEAGRFFDIWGLALEQKGKKYFGGEVDRWRLTGGLIDKKPHKRFTEADFVSGSLMIIKKSVIDKIGLFDERFFMYYEDVDYCLRAKQAGFKVGVDAGLIYKHFEVSQNYPQKNDWLEKSHQKFFFKYGRTHHIIWEFLRKRKFLLNFLSLNFSSFLGKCFNFVLFIFLIRTLSLAEYGVYTLVWAQTVLLAPFVDLGTTSYGLVYLPFEKPTRFRSLFNLRLMLSLIVFVLTVLISFFTLKFNGRLVLFTALVGFTIFSNMFSGTYLIISSIKEKAYLSSVISTLFNLIFVSLLIIILLITKSLIMVFLMIFFFYNLYSLINYLLLKKNLNKFRPKLYDQSWPIIARKSFIFVLIALFANFYFKADLFLLNFIKGEEAVAIYSVGYKFLEVLLIIASSYTISATPNLVRMFKENKRLFMEKIRRDSLLLFAFGLIISLAVYFAGAWFLPIILKGGYQGGVVVARIVVFSLPLILINTIFYNSLYVMSKASSVVYLFIIQFLINFFLNFLLIPSYSYFASAYLTVFSEILNSVISFILVYENLRRWRSPIS